MSNEILEKINSIMPELKGKDLRYSKLSSRLKILYLVLIPVYLVIFTLDLIERFSVNSLISGVCYVMSFVVFYLIFRKYSNEYKNVDYSLPMLEMLKKGAYRYYPMRKETWWAIVSVVLIDIALSLQGPLGDDIILQQVIFFGMITMSAGIGVVVWWFKYKPLRDDIMKLIKEIES